VEGGKEELKEGLEGNNSIKAKAVKQLPLFKSQTVSKSVSSAVSTVSSTVSNSTVSSVINTVPCTISTVSKKLYNDTVQQKDMIIEHMYSMYLEVCKSLANANNVVELVIDHAQNGSNTRNWTEFNRFFNKVQAFI
jgi:hypothetical protein